MGLQLLGVKRNHHYRSLSTGAVRAANSHTCTSYVTYLTSARPPSSITRAPSLNKKLIPGNEDTDQSISDAEDEQGASWSEKSVSLAGTVDRTKESFGVASHLDLLKGLRQKDVGYSSKDEVEIPDFLDKGSLGFAHNLGGKPISSKRAGSIREGDQHISDDEGSKILFKSVIAGATVSETLDLYTREKGKRFRQSSVSAGDGDSRRQIQLDENSSCFTHCCHKDDKLTTVGGRQPQRRSTCHFQSHKKGSFWHSVHESNNLESTIDDDLLDEPEASNSLLMDKPAYSFYSGIGCHL